MNALFYDPFINLEDWCRSVRPTRSLREEIICGSVEVEDVEYVDVSDLDAEDQGEEAYCVLI